MLPPDGDRVAVAPAMTLGEVALYATFAALVAGVGPLIAIEVRAGGFRAGMAGGLSAGMMLGLAYPLMRDGLSTGATMATAGGVVVVLLLLLAHVAYDLDGPTFPTPGQAIRAAAVHAAPEGLALGVAGALDARLGMVVAFTLALHNASEAVALTSQLGPAVERWRAVVLSVLTNVPQVALGVAGFVLATAFPSVRPALLGASAGPLVYLSLADLLPDAYRGAGRTAVSVAVIGATSMVAFAAALS